MQEAHCALQVQEWNSEQLSVAITQRVAETLYSLKAELEGVPLAEVVRPGVALEPAVDSEALMPLIEEQIDGLRHSWLSRRQVRFLGTIIHSAQGRRSSGDWGGERCGGVTTEANGSEDGW